MAQKETLEIEIQGKDSGGKATVSQQRDVVAELETAVKALNSELAKAGGDPERFTSLTRAQRELKEALSDNVQKLKELQQAESGVEDVTKQFGALGQLISTLSGGQLSGLGSALGDVGRAGSAAGSAIEAGLSPVLVVVGALTAAVALLAAGLGAIIGLAFEAVKTANSFAESVEGIKRVTGATTEYAAALATAGKLSGIDPEQTRNLLAQQTSLFEAAEIRLRKIKEDTEAANALAGDKRAQIESDNAARVFEIRKDEADKLEALTDAQREREQAFAKARTDLEANYAANALEIEQSLAAKLDDINQQHAERLADLDKQQLRTKEDFERASLERNRAFNEQQVEQQQTLAERLKTLDDDRAKAVDDLNKSILRLEADNTARRVQNEEDYNRQAATLARDLARTREDYARDSAERDAALAANLADNAARLADKLADITDRRAERQRAAEESIEDLQLAFADRQQARQDRLAERQAALDEKTNSQREALQSRLNNARDGFEETALQAEIAALDARTEKEKATLADKASAEDTKAKTELDAKLAKIQERLDRERAAFNAQTEQLKADAEKRAAELNAVEQQQAADAQRTNERRVADLQERIAQEAQAYAEQSTSVAASYTAQLEALRARIAEENAATDAQKAKLKADYDERAAQQIAALQRETDEAKRQNEQRVADLQDRLARENAHNTEALNEAVARGVVQTEKLKAAYEKDVENSKARYDKQTSDNTAAQVAIYNATVDRLAKETDAYNEAGEQVNDALKERLRSIAQEVTPATEAIDKLGLSEEALGKLTPIEQTKALAEAFVKLKDPADKAYVAQNLFGDASEKTLRFITALGSKSMPDLVEQTKQYNLNWTDADLKRQLDTAQAFRDTDTAMLGFATTGGKQAASAAGEVAKGMTDLITSSGTFLDKNGPALQTLFGGIATAIGSATTALTNFFDILNGKNLINSLSSLGSNPLISALFPGIGIAANGSAAVGRLADQAAPGGNTVNNNTINYNGTPAPTPGDVLRSLATLLGF